MCHSIIAFIIAFVAYSILFYSALLNHKSRSAYNCFMALSGICLSSLDILASICMHMTRKLKSTRKLDIHMYTIEFEVRSVSLYGEIIVAQFARGDGIA